MEATRHIPYCNKFRDGVANGRLRNLFSLMTGESGCIYSKYKRHTASRSPGGGRTDMHSFSSIGTSTLCMRGVDP